MLKCTLLLFYIKLYVCESELINYVIDKRNLISLMTKNMKNDPNN